MGIRASIVLIGLLLTLCAPTARGELKASAGCVSGRIIVINKDPVPWLEVKIQLNRDYFFERQKIDIGETVRVPPGVFTKPDGTRFDIDSTACKTIDIHATVGGKREHWNGGYE
jgi:hypothetical protein